MTLFGPPKISTLMILLHELLNVFLYLFYLFLVTIFFNCIKIQLQFFHGVLEIATFFKTTGSIHMNRVDPDIHIIRSLADAQDFLIMFRGIVPLFAAFV